MTISIHQYASLSVMCSEQSDIMNTVPPGLNIHP
jgi:hypothetical protein